MMKTKDLEELMVVLEKESEPLWFTNMYVEKPCIPCGICYVILIILAFLSQAAKLLEPTLGGDKGRDYGVMSSIEQQSWDKIILGNEYMTNTSTDEFPQQSIMAAPLIFLYEAQDGKDLLTVDALKEMKEIEEVILKDAEWKKYCLKYYGTDKCMGTDPFSATFGGIDYEWTMGGYPLQYGYSGMYSWLVGDQDIDLMTNDLLK